MEKMGEAKCKIAQLKCVKGKKRKDKQQKI
jgi:hypothetical protein